MKKSRFLLDSNVLIYAMNKRKCALDFFRSHKSAYFATSAVSRLEVLLGESKEEMSMEEMENELDDFQTIVLDNKIVRSAALLHGRNKKTLKFKDLVIEASANVNGLTLVTADKDFRAIEGLKVKLLKI